MLSDVVVQARRYSLVVSFYSVVGLRMVCSSCQVLDTKKVAHHGEEHACKLRSVVGQQEFSYLIEDNLVLKELVSDVCRCSF